MACALGFSGLLLDGFDKGSGKSRSCSPSSEAPSTCAGSLPGGAASSPESARSVGSPAHLLELAWTGDDISTTATSARIVEGNALSGAIAPPPGLEAVGAPAEVRGALVMCAPPGLAAGNGILDAPPGLGGCLASAPPGLGALSVMQNMPTVPPPPWRLALHLSPAIGVAPPPSFPPPPPMAAPLVAAPPEAPQPPPPTAAPLAAPQLPPPTTPASANHGLGGCLAAPQLPPPPTVPPAPLASADALVRREPAPGADASARALEFPSAGSGLHRFGMCKPCAFYHAKGCSSGRDCGYCHLCGPKEASQRKKERRTEIRRPAANRGRSRAIAVAAR